MHVVIPWSDYEPQTFRVTDYAAYYRRVKKSLAQFLSETLEESTYPEPKEHCDVCRWRSYCDARRRADDHLCLVAGITKIQINELRRREISTVEALATMELPLSWKPERGATGSYERIREQARIQVEGRLAGKPIHEVLPVVQGFGLSNLPTPSPGDIFLDLEGDPFVGENGLEYLFGYSFANEGGEHEYICEWAISRANEKQAFQNFVDFVITRWARYPELHIYHYAPYEPAALKRLMGRYATREQEIDRMLRASLFVDLYAIVRHSIRASVESYSIKRLEPQYAYVRGVDLVDANRSLAVIQACLELADPEGIPEEEKAAVQGYNRDDCISTQCLRDWLEGIRSSLIEKGKKIDRPVPTEGSPSPAQSKRQEIVERLVARLTTDVPLAAENRSVEQQARWILAHVLDFHKREEKTVWWEYFTLSAMSVEELLDEGTGLSGLEFVGITGGTAKAPIHQYRFPPQDTDLRGEEAICSVGGDKLGKVTAISFKDRTIEIKKRKDTAAVHPKALFAHDTISKNVLADALLRIGEYVADNTIAGIGPYQTARDLLLREPPRISGEQLRLPDETPLDAALRLAPKLSGGVLPIQGPPGSGKTFIGARMVCELVKAGAKVGITANSHKVIRNFLDEVVKAADERSMDLNCIQKADDAEDDRHRLAFATTNKEVFAALNSSCQVAAGTAWLWARQDARQTVDVLFVDEAAQMALPNVLAISHAGTSLVLLGDPQQLEQPIQGSHPEGTDVSALDHILAGQQTIGAHAGLFLEETWRLHPDICKFTSELFYEGRLKSHTGLEMQTVKSTGRVHGTGLRYLPVVHEGNQSSAPEEAAEVWELVKNILGSNATWVDRENQERRITLADILIIAPYNAQVFELEDRIPGARIGTVDKFQGQEAPIVIYSMATSSHADAPRGIEFLYSRNRLNVATSRAKCISILVASPQLFEAECRTPRQMRLINAFCRFREVAIELSLS